MNINDKINLDNLMKQNNVKDQTNHIRTLKHSELIKKDFNAILKIQNHNPNLTHEELDKLCVSNANFLFTNYTDIYNKLVKKQLDILIFVNIIKILKKIEDGDCDQHEGSFEVGTLLKKLYIDSALKRTNELNEKYEQTTNETVETKEISWKQYKVLHNN